MLLKMYKMLDNELFLQIKDLWQICELLFQVNEDMFIYNSTKGFYCVMVPENSTVANDTQDLSSVPLQERCLAPSKGRSHPYIVPEVREQLTDFFEPFNKRFFQRIGRTFDWN